MYLHLGQGTVVRTAEVVGIFDLDNTSVAKATRQYLARAQKGGRVVNVTDELPKTFVVAIDEEGSTTVYISQISAATLKKRANYITELKF